MPHVGNLKGKSREEIGLLLRSHFGRTNQSNVTVPPNTPFVSFKTDGKTGKISMSKNQPKNISSLNKHNIKIKSANGGNGSARTVTQTFQIAPEPKKQINPLIILGIIAGGFFIVKFIK